MKNLYTENYRKLMKEIEENPPKMGKYSMLLDWKNKYCLNVDTTQSNLRIQCHPYQNNTSILHRARTNNLKIGMEPGKTPNNQSNLEKENQSRRHHNPRHQAILQSCNHQDSMVLAQEQTLRSMEQNREPRNGDRKSVV